MAISLVALGDPHYYLPTFIFIVKCNGLMPHEEVTLPHCTVLFLYTKTAQLNIFSQRDCGIYGHNWSYSFR